MADSWLIDGDCSVCRRKNYCSTECKLHGIRNQRMIQSFVMNKMMGAMIHGMCNKTNNDESKNE